MPYVAPMPNPDMVTGPDWTTLLGSVALGLTKGVGEGAEILQRDKAQKMQQQRDAVEQAYRDRQAERAEQHWSADQAYRGDQTKIAQADREGAAWVEKLEGDLTGIDDNVSPEVADAARRHLRQWRLDKSTREYHDGILKNRHDASLWATYAKLMAKNPKAAAQFANENGLQIENTGGASDSLRATNDPPSAYSGAPVATGVDESGNVIEDVSDAPPTELAPPDWYDNPKTKYKPNLPIEAVEQTAEVDPYGGVYSGNMLKGYTDPYAPGFYDRQKQAWEAKETKTASSNLDYSPRPYPYQKPERIVTKTKSPWDEGYDGPPARQSPPPVPPQAMGEERPPKTLPMDALTGLDQPTQKLVLRALAGDAVAYADLKRNRPGLVEQIMQKRKSK